MVLVIDPEFKSVLRLLCAITLKCALIVQWLNLNLNTALCFEHTGEGCGGLQCSGPLFFHGGWARREEHV